MSASPTPPSRSTLHGPTEVSDLVQAWLVASRRYPVKGSARLLARLLKHEEGLAFLTTFVDGVIRPEDANVAARNVRMMSRRDLRFLPGYQRVLLRVGAVASYVLPSLVVMLARRTVRVLVAHLIVDATPARLGPALGALRRKGHRLNVNLLGEAVLGNVEAAKRLERLTTLLGREDVDYVSLKVSSTIAPHSPWAFDENVAHIVTTLRPLYRVAIENKGSFINLDMEEFRDLDLTIEVFTALLGEQEFRSLSAGIVLQAYLPDSMAAMERLQQWASARVTGGGAPIKVRLVKGANLSMERVDAEIHGWPLATWGSKAESDAHYKRLVDYALVPEHTRSVRVGIAGHNLFDIAHAHLTAVERHVSDDVDFEMLLGMGEHVAQAIARDIGPLRLYTPVVHPKEFDVALAYLVRRLEEVAGKDNFMSALYELDTDATVFAREQERFLTSWRLVHQPVPPSLRATPSIPNDASHGFTNTPDRDPSVPANRRWARQILDAAPASTLGAATLAGSRIDDTNALSREIGIARHAAPAWQSLAPQGRADVLHAAGRVLEARRADLIEVMIAEAGKTLEQADPEVSEAIDFAHYYAERSLDLWVMPGATPAARAVTLVVPPWNFPVAIPAGSTLAALAAGSTVILKPAKLTARCGAVLAEALWEAGVPRDVLRLIDIDSKTLGDPLIADERIDQVVLTGSYETADRFLKVRPSLRLFAETSGKNSIIVTPSADVDLAVKDVVASAFGHAGQKCSAASLVIAVGSVGSSRRFLGQLEDAVRSLTVGASTDPLTQMGPVIEPAKGKLERALTTLEPGERWIVEPVRLDQAGYSWSPGLKAGIAAGSFFHLTECFGPVLGVMTADSLEEAIAIQNAAEYGLTAGLHSLDESEVSRWLAHVEAGNAYVNRGITGAIVQRQPFGGWKRSVVGPSLKAGGPHYLTALTGWHGAPLSQADVDPEPGKVLAFLEASEAHRWVRSAAAADARAWEERFGTVTDASGLHCEANLFRYVPADTQVWWDGLGDTDGLARVCAARVRAGGTGLVSAPATLPVELAAALEAAGITVSVESWEACLARAAATPGGRIRLVANGPADLNGSVSVSVYFHEVTANGDLELLPFLKEQAVSITAHRFGTPQRRVSIARGGDALGA